MKSRVNRRVTRKTFGNRRARRDVYVDVEQYLPNREEMRTTLARLEEQRDDLLDPEEIAEFTNDDIMDNTIGIICRTSEPLTAEGEATVRAFAEAMATGTVDNIEEFNGDFWEQKDDFLFNPLVTARVRPVVRYRPWTAAEAVGKTVRASGYKPTVCRLIVGSDGNSVLFGDHSMSTCDALLAKFVETTTGQPAGVQISGEADE